MDSFYEATITLQSQTKISYTHTKFRGQYHCEHEWKSPQQKLSESPAMHEKDYMP